MRKIKYYVLIILVVFGLSTCKEKSGVEKKSNEITNKVHTSIGIETLLPDSSFFMLKFNNINALYNEIIPALNLNKEDMAEFKKEIGFNPLILDELNDFGIDQSREFGFVLNDFKIVDLTYKEPPVMSISFFIPVFQGKNISKKIADLIVKKHPKYKFTEKDGLYNFPTDKNGLIILMKEYNKYLFITMDYKTDSNKFYTSLGKSPIGYNEVYQHLISKTGDKGNLSVFMNFKNTTFFDDISKMTNKQRGRKISKFNNIFKGYDGFYMTADASGPDLLINSSSILEKDSPIMQLHRDIKYTKNSVLGISEKPLLYLSFGINSGKYMNMVRQNFTAEQVEKFKMSVSALKQELGIDLDEIIETLGGNFNYAMYNGKKINMFNYNTVFSLSVKDKAKGKLLLNKLLNAIKKKIGERMTVEKKNIEGVETSVIMISTLKLHIGVKDGSLIFATNKSYYEQAIKGDVTKGFTANLDKSLADKFMTDDVFYLSFDEGIKVFENFKFLVMMGLKRNKKNGNKTSDEINKITKIVNYFQYIMTSNTKNDNGFFKMNFILKTRFKKSFILGIIDIINNLNKKNKLIKKTI